MKFNFILIFVSIYFISLFNSSFAQNLLVSEDFSSAEWETELKRLNPGQNQFGALLNQNAPNPAAYTTPAVGGGNAYLNLNSTDLYFGKYKLNGAIEVLDILPCSLGEKVTHTNISAVEINFADPTIYAEEGKFYLTGTRGGTPLGFILLESTNLADWKLSTSDPSGMVLKQGESAYGESGFWAPQFFKNGSTYHLVYTASEHVAISKSAILNAKYTQDMISAIDPEAKNIDPFLFKDDDGKYYLYHVRFNKGNYIWVAEFDISTGKINKQTLRQCLNNTEPWESTPAYESAPIMEGPSVIKKDGLYYLFYSANHYQSVDYAVGYATATTPYGPWTKYSHNPIIHRSIVHENGSGHGDIFFGQNNVPYYVYHVHKSDSVVAPRKTRIVPLQFTFNSTTGIYDISAKANEIIIPKVRASTDEEYSDIESTFLGTKKAVAFRLTNNATGMIQFPEIPSAGSITIHIRNGNSGNPTNVALEKLVDGTWTQIHQFNLLNWNSYPDFRDEVLTWNINSSEPVTLRLINNVAANRYMNLYRIDITSKTQTALLTGKTLNTLKISGRKLQSEKPVHIAVYNQLGMLLLQTHLEKEIELPVKIGTGIFIVKTNSEVKKILLE